MTRSGSIVPGSSLTGRGDRVIVTIFGPPLPLRVRSASTSNCLIPTTRIPITGNACMPMAATSSAWREGLQIRGARATQTGRCCFACPGARCGLTSRKVSSCPSGRRDFASAPPARRAARPRHPSERRRRREPGLGDPHNARRQRTATRARAAGSGGTGPGLQRDCLGAATGPALTIRRRGKNGCA